MDVKIRRMFGADDEKERRLWMQSYLYQDSRRGEELPCTLFAVRTLSPQTHGCPSVLVLPATAQYRVQPRRRRTEELCACEALKLALRWGSLKEGVCDQFRNRKPRRIEVNRQSRGTMKRNIHLLIV